VQAAGDRIPAEACLSSRTFVKFLHSGDPDVMGLSSHVKKNIVLTGLHPIGAGGRGSNPGRGMSVLRPLGEDGVLVKFWLSFSIMLLKFILIFSKILDIRSEFLPLGNEIV
jgi:hypothetical protein